MTHWIETSPALARLGAPERALLQDLNPMDVPKGAVLFRPGDAVQGFVLVLQGRVEVFLTGANGRELMLYAVEPGQTCVQTTLGLLGEADYTGEAIATTPSRIVLVPRPTFLRLMEDSPSFRALVFSSMAVRMEEVIRLMERVSFQSVESRLASWLLARAENSRVAATHAEIAAQIGSAREVVSRRLDAFARRGWVRTERGLVEICDAAALKRLDAVTEGA
ncbi:CRP/FNR family transcriptional regulator [Rhodobacter aestuarii]|uniref:CRP/FNR family transcriptional regulator, anaerobic regulatory protein n=1 Tax=Rhodobacter aestuarii TaxID=453582 RepID=A0A1N7J7N5_9RHOB|nr:Crp/Fnr family transcriptional regulator [Rhodobacter aestuarii]PTV97096.1 CRP/FNR family transcriptional regulator [Rhodobacter aestuarii]SIS45332.1 CRP/FNR family transcriptional regulator, anaerobic regulatory protein [Rhodobacter aestuarii]